MHGQLTEIGEAYLREILVGYHIAEEFLIAFFCAVVAARAARTAAGRPDSHEGRRSRIQLVAAAFTLLGLSSLIHGLIHLFDLQLNLLYQTILGYCLGLLILIAAASSEEPRRLAWLPLLYLPMTVLLVPGVAARFASFGDFRPLAWIAVAYLSGIVCMLYVATWYRTRHGRFLASATGHILICVAAVLLFFPAPIGSGVWFYGHLLRPLGFVVLAFSMNRDELTHLGGSMLYRVLSAFSLLAGLPLLLFGSFFLYENIRPTHVIGERMLVFLLLLATLLSALLFGLGLIIRLIRPILDLKDSVGRLVDEGFEHRLATRSHDEIGELTDAFNEMTVKLRGALDEQNRLSRLAATGELAATLAHEIKNPLNAINGAAAYLRRNFRGELIDEFLGVISDEVSRINRLTTTLLHFGKPQTPTPVPIDLNALIRSTARLFEAECREQGVRLETRTVDDLPEVRCDPAQIKQVLINLLVNAVDAVGSEGVIRIRPAARNGTVSVSVEDNGPGIDPETRKHIFNPFFTTKTRGTGLGLAISKKILKDHGGDLTVESTPGRGSTFTLAFRRGIDE